MKIALLFFSSITFSLIGLGLIAYNIESGDLNAVSMYFLVYGLFAVGIGLLNGLFISISENIIQKLISQIGLAILPIAILIGLWIFGSLRIAFIAKFGLIGIGITNLLWIIITFTTMNKKACV